jgi:hypothetical protein
MYTSIPVRAAGNYYANLNLPDQIPADGDIRVAIRIARSYRTYATAPIINATQPLTIGTTYYVAQPPVIHNNDTFLLAGESFVAATTNFVGTTGTSGVVGSVTTSVPKNNFNPLYTFGTGDLANITNNSDVAQDALDLINVVPNPYYAFSSYETSQLDNRIKITNLPPKCTVSIFTVNGTLVRKFKRDVSSDNSAGEVFSTATTNAETSIDWDLKNHKNIPIASGMYLIHVEAPGLGERTLKWFGMIRPIDLDTF